MSIWDNILKNVLTIDVLWYVPAILISMTLHEVSHGFAAYKLGDTTAKSQGRLSLNPIKHIDIMGLIMLIVAKFGWAKPVQVDVRNFKDPKKDMALCAAAGPISNFILAFFSMIVIYTLSNFENAVTYYVSTFFIYFMSVNISLGIFNLIPIPPLDGSKVFAALLPDGAYIRYMRFERYGFMALMLLLYFGTLSNFLMRLRELVWQGLYIAVSVPIDAIVALFTGG